MAANSIPHKIEQVPFMSDRLKCFAVLVLAYMILDLVLFTGICLALYFFCSITSVPIPGINNPGATVVPRSTLLLLF